MITREIDENGFFVSDSEHAPDETHILENWGNQSLIRPRWNGKEWKEGASEAVIEKTEKKNDIQNKINRAMVLIEQAYEMDVDAEKYRRMLRRAIKNWNNILEGNV